MMMMCDIIGGEYESLVLDCPLFKHYCIELTKTEIVIDDEDASVGNLHVDVATLVPKKGNNNVVVKISKTQLQQLQGGEEGGGGGKEKGVGERGGGERVDKELDDSLKMQQEHRNDIINQIKTETKAECKVTDGYVLYVDIELKPVHVRLCLCSCL